MGAPDSVTQIILFDGVCNLCNGAVQFIIKHDSKKQFTFASLQSTAAHQLLNELSLIPSMKTMVLIKGKRAVEKSNAALEIARQLDGAWRWLYVLKIVPRCMRDAVYTLVANSRYRLFGKRDSCWLPTPELESRFIA
jgi:predicted DCC family thiol-disulfide oxidoreductase YuxK